MNNWCGGGGGGAGAAASGYTGGAGRVLSITGSAVEYGRGGNADCYPSTNRDANGATNTGNGGSGAGDGGSGVIVVAYPGGARGTGGSISSSSRPGWTVHVFEGTGAYSLVLF